MTPDYKAQWFKTTRSRADLQQGRTDWYKIDPVNKHTNGTTEAVVRLYQEIGWIGVTAEEFAAEIEALDVDVITLRIKSLGGSIFDGLAIYAQLRDHPATVNVIIDGVAASAAAFIAMAGDTISMQPEAMMMIHDGFAFTGGNAKDLRDLADLLDTVSGNVANIFARRAGPGASAEAFREMMLAETWFTAAEAVAAGLADEIVGESDDDDDDRPPDNSWDLSVFAYAGRSAAPAPDLASLIASIAPDPVPEPEPEPDLPDAAIDVAAFLAILNK